MLKLAKNIGEHQYKSATFLKAELLRRGVSYQALSERLQKIGVKRSPEAIRQGLHRGSLSMAFLFQCLDVLGAKRLDVISSLKYHLKLNGLTYKDLSEKLAKIGVQKAPTAIANILSRGKLSNDLLEKCATVLNIETDKLNHLTLAF